MYAASTSLDVAIIGAGLSGLALALVLHQQGIKCTIYENRPKTLNIGGALMLFPNALKILDALGVYPRIQFKGYNFEYLEFKDEDGKVLATQEFGSKSKYGYKALRIYRHVLINELLTMLQESHIPVEHCKKISHIISETDDAVTWQFTDGTTHSPSLLIGADGIHSTVRKYLHPDLQPKFTGMAGITAAVPTAQLKLPKDYHTPAAIITPKGGFVIAPQEVDGSEVLIGKQKCITELDRAEWESNLADKASLVAFLQEDSNAFPEFVRNAVEKIEYDKINVWPFYVVPKLKNWVSKNGKGMVAILGDAAHAIPPSAGQGINQAFEDVYIFGLLMGSVKTERVRIASAVEWWMRYRMERVEKVLELNR